MPSALQVAVPQAGEPRDQAPNAKPASAESTDVPPPPPPPFPELPSPPPPAEPFPEPAATGTAPCGLSDTGLGGREPQAYAGILPPRSSPDALDVR
eukprot:14458314-Alexandrium_andersonii.AAC.1